MHFVDSDIRIDFRIVQINDKSTIYAQNQTLKSMFLLKNTVRRYTTNEYKINDLGGYLDDKHFSGADKNI